MIPAGPRVAVVGGGISGLAAAHRLRTLLGTSAKIILLDRADRIGGVLRTVELAGRPYDVGAEAFLARRPEVPALAAELGLEGELVHPSTAVPLLRAGGRTVPLPGGTLLGVPTGAAGLDAVLSAAGLARVAAEPELPLRWVPGTDTALGPVLRERFGAELVDRLVDPLLGGVYAGRVDALGLRATIPALVAALDGGAPCFTAAASAGLRAGLGSGPVFGAFRAGYRVLVDALVSQSGAEFRLGTTVRELHRRGEGWRLVCGPAPRPHAAEVDAVLLAVPAPALRRLLADVAPDAAAAADVELASSAVVALAYRESDVEAALPAASGVLVATGEPLVSKGFTFSARKWPHLAADGVVRLRGSLGRYGEARTLQVDDDDLLAQARADLAALTGITAEPIEVHVQRWGGGLPQYGVGHLNRVAKLRDVVAAQPGLAVAGALLNGVGVPACIATARAAADRLAGRLAGRCVATRLAAPS